MSNINKKSSIAVKITALAASLVAIPVAAVVFPQMTSSQPDSGICITAHWEEDPSISENYGDCPPETDSEPVIPPVSSPTQPANPGSNNPVVPNSSAAPAPTTPSTVPTGNNFSSCDDVEFTANPGVFVKCELNATNWAQDVYKVTVWTNQTTPIKWKIDVNNKTAKGFIKTDLDASMAFDRWESYSRTYSVVGTDRSWNGDRTEYINAAYVSNLKSYDFMVRNTWRKN